MKPISYACDLRFQGEALCYFKPIINAWFQILEDYANLSPGNSGLKSDSVFGYRERPQVGFLAAAAWRAGGVALEEWGTKKGEPEIQSYGRNDLWIRLGEHEWFIEAKHMFCNIGKDASTAEMASHLAWACADMGKLRSSDQTKMAALFVSPLWNEERRPDRTAALAEWKNACEQVNADLAAIVLDTESADPEWAGLALFLASTSWKNSFPKSAGQLAS